jgi:hypothetical protein
MIYLYNKDLYMSKKIIRLTESNLKKYIQKIVLEQQGTVAMPPMDEQKQNTVSNDKLNSTVGWVIKYFHYEVIKDESDKNHVVLRKRQNGNEIELYIANDQVAYYVNYNNQFDWKEKGMTKPEKGWLTDDISKFNEGMLGDLEKRIFVKNSNGGSLIFKMDEQKELRKRGFKDTGPLPNQFKLENKILGYSILIDAVKCNNGYTGMKISINGKEYNNGNYKKCPDACWTVLDNIIGYDSLKHIGDDKN